MINKNTEQKATKKTTGQTRNQTIKLSLLLLAILFSFASCSSFMVPPAFLVTEYDQTTTQSQLPSTKHLIRHVAFLTLVLFGNKSEMR
jgi:hypothetical protein